LARRADVKRKFSFGFTLLELLVVMVIIGLLAGYVGPRYFSQIRQIRGQAPRAQIDALEKARTSTVSMSALPDDRAGVAGADDGPLGRGTLGGALHCARQFPKIRGVSRTSTASRVSTGISTCFPMGRTGTRR